MLIVNRNLDAHIMAGWQSGYAEDCKSLYVGSIPVPASKKTCGQIFFFLVYTGQSFYSSIVFPGSSVVEQAAVNRLVAGSSPARGAIF